MSVAFRRESDEEHLEPKFELPVPPGPNIVTQRGYALIGQRTEELEAQVAGMVDDEQRKAVQRDLRYWRARLATAQIAPSATGETVAIGTRVTIEQNGQRRALGIVGHDEADPGSGLIAFTSPLGKALIGAGEGDEVEGPGTGGSITVVAIEPL